MIKLAVGQKFPAKIKGEVGMSWSRQPMLVLNWSGITEKEVVNVKDGASQFRLYVRDNIIFLCFKFGELPWMDTAYTVHLERTPVDVSEPIDDGEGYGLHVYLVDADTQTIKVMRLIGLSTSISRKLQQALIKQQAAEFDGRIHQMQIQNIYSVMSSADMAAQGED